MKAPRDIQFTCHALGISEGWGLTLTCFTYAPLGCFFANCGIAIWVCIIIKVKGKKSAYLKKVPPYAGELWAKELILSFVFACVYLK